MHCQVCTSFATDPATVATFVAALQNMEAARTTLLSHPIGQPAGLCRWRAALSKAGLEWQLWWGWALTVSSTGELLKLQLGDLMLSHNQGVANLPLTKTGLGRAASEALPIFDRWLLRTLTHVASNTRSEPTATLESLRTEFP